MTSDELIKDIYAELPSKKRLVSRGRVERCVARTLKKWPVAVLAQCDEPQAAVVGKYLARSVEREERAEYGMGFFAAIILSTLIGEIVKIILRKWLENRDAIAEAIR